MYRPDSSRGKLGWGQTAAGARQCGQGRIRLPGGWGALLLGLLLAASWSGPPARAQIMPISRLTVPDSSTHLFGRVNASLLMDLQQTLVLTLRAGADVSRRVKRSRLVGYSWVFLTRSNEAELSNSGAFHFRVMDNNTRRLWPELFVQYQWDQARGMQNRGLLGANLRWLVLHDTLRELTSGLGLMAEYEQWGYEGVNDESLIPDPPTNLQQTLPKLNLYLLYKHDLTEQVHMQHVLYYQAVPDRRLAEPRLTYGGVLEVELTDLLSLGLSLDLLYDTAPVVPIRKLYFRNLLTLNINW